MALREFLERQAAPWCLYVAAPDIHSGLFDGITIGKPPVAIEIAEAQIIGAVLAIVSLIDAGSHGMKLMAEPFRVNAFHQS